MSAEWMESRSKEMAFKAERLYDYTFHSASHLAWAQQRAYGWPAEFSLVVAMRIKMGGLSPREAFDVAVNECDDDGNLVWAEVFNPFYPVARSVGDAQSLDLQLEAAYGDERAAEHLLTFGAQAIDAHTADSLRVLLVATQISVSRKMFDYEYTHEMVW